jgi:hypothetical protein
MSTNLKSMWTRRQARKARELEAELHAEEASELEDHLLVMTNGGDPKMMELTGRRIGWEGLTARPAYTGWKGD